MTQLQNLPQTGPPVTVADEVEKLSRLRDAGALTDEEFETHKERLLTGAASWRYLCIDLDLATEAGRAKLADLGEEGWELVHFSLGNPAAHSAKSGMTLSGGQEGDWVFKKPDVRSPDQTSDRAVVQRIAEGMSRRRASDADGPAPYRVAQMSALPLGLGAARVHRRQEQVLVIVTLMPEPPEHELWWWMEQLSAASGHQVRPQPYDSLMGTFSIRVSAEELEPAIRDLRIGVEEVSARYPEGYLAEQQQVSEEHAAEERDRKQAQEALQVVVDRVMGEPRADAHLTSRLQRLDRIATLFEQFEDYLAACRRRGAVHLNGFDRDPGGPLRGLEAELPRCEEAASRLRDLRGSSPNLESTDEKVDELVSSVAEARTEITEAIARCRQDAGLPPPPPSGGDDGGEGQVR